MGRPSSPMERGTAAPTLRSILLWRNGRPSQLRLGSALVKNWFRLAESHTVTLIHGLCLTGLLSRRYSKLDAIPVTQPAVSNFEALEGTDAIEENQSLDVQWLVMKGPTTVPHSLLRRTPYASAWQSEFQISVIQPACFKPWLHVQFIACNKLHM